MAQIWCLNRIPREKLPYIDPGIDLSSIFYFQRTSFRSCPTCESSNFFRNRRLNGENGVRWPKSDVTVGSTVKIYPGKTLESSWNRFFAPKWQVFLLFFWAKSRFSRGNWWATKSGQTPQEPIWITLSWKVGEGRPPTYLHRCIRLGQESSKIALLSVVRFSSKSYFKF